MIQGAAALLLLALLSEPAIAAKPPAPKGRTYFTVIMGLADSGRYDLDADCLRFDADQMCTTDGDICLDWSWVDEPVRHRKRSGFRFRTRIVEEEDVIEIAGQGRTEAAGAWSSFAAAANATVTAEQGTGRLNFSLAGRETSPSRCEVLLDQFLANQASN